VQVSTDTAERREDGGLPDHLRTRVAVLCPGEQTSLFERDRAGLTGDDKVVTRSQRCAMVLSYGKM
jgi:hypothetical protein